jgi:predicted nicotinamide N-methyase
MSAPEFDIIFRGDIVFGHQLAEVKAKLQQLFKADAAKIDALFTGRPVPLATWMRQLPINTAMR